MTDPTVATAAKEAIRNVLEESGEHQAAYLADAILARVAPLLEGPLQAEIERLSVGPYEAGPCHDHWHIYVDGMELTYGAMDEAKARALAAKLNADNIRDVSRLTARVAEIEAAARSLDEALTRCKPTLDGYATMAYLHGGGAYNGPTFGEEWQTLRALVSRAAPTSEELHG